MIKESRGLIIAFLKNFTPIIFTNAHALFKPTRSIYSNQLGGGTTLVVRLCGGGAESVLSSGGARDGLVGWRGTQCTRTTVVGHREVAWRRSCKGWGSGGVTAVTQGLRLWWCDEGACDAQVPVMCSHNY